MHELVTNREFTTRYYTQLEKRRHAHSAPVIYIIQKRKEEKPTTLKKKLTYAGFRAFAVKDGS